jgi:glycosyltransferase involved in cell wall biosynthesis
LARVRRTISGVLYARSAISVARETRPVIVHANDWNTMWAAIAVKLIFRSRIVYDNHELWADRNGRWEWRPWLVASEALFVRAADAVVASSPGYASALAERYRIAAPVVVRNVCSSAPVQPSERPPKPVVTYVGGLMIGRGLERAIGALRHAPEFRLRMIGPGSSPYRDHLRELAEDLGVGERVELGEVVPPEELPALTAGSVAGLCLIEPICRSYELSLPNKLFEYAAAGVPVIASDLPGIAGVVRSAGTGEVVALEDPRSIAAAMRRLTVPDTYSRVSERAHAFALANSWQDEAVKLADVYAKLLGRSASETHPA